MWERIEQQIETRDAEAATPQTLEGAFVADDACNITWGDISRAVTELESRTGIRLTVPDLGGNVKVYRDRTGHPKVANGCPHANILIGLYSGRKVSATRTDILVLCLNFSLRRIGGCQGLYIRQRQI